MTKPKHTHTSAVIALRGHRKSDWADLLYAWRNEVGTKAGWDGWVRKRFGLGAIRILWPEEA